MLTPARPTLTPGKVYRTADLRRWGRNTTRLARRLERSGRLETLTHGLYVCPRRGSFGPVPPRDEDVLKAFLKGSKFIFTGPTVWNRLGLQSTAAFADTWVYNTKRTCTLQFGNRRLHLRRVRFPTNPSPEWYAVDLLENHEAAGTSLSELERDLRTAVAAGRFDPDRLQRAAREYGTRKTRALVERATPASPGR